MSFDPPVFVPMLFFFFTTEYYRGRMEKIQAAGRFLRVILVLVVATRIIYAGFPCCQGTGEQHAKEYFWTSWHAKTGEDTFIYA